MNMCYSFKSIRVYSAMVFAAVLLAASWGATLSVDEIASEVSQSLDLLATDWSYLPARQRSMRATFDHTWKLLDERKRAVFQSLSVFRGAFTRRVAQVVAVMGDQVQLMDMETYETFDMAIPDDFKGKMSPGEEIQYLEALGKKKITRV